MKKTLMFILSAAFLFSILIITGCERREEPRDDMEETDTLAVQEDTLRQEEADPDTAEFDLTGTWSGTLDQRQTTLRITNQNGNEFDGAITIHYRERIDQTIKGSINPETRRVSMRDQQHSRAAGTYTATLSEDGTRLTGTFTQNVDKNNFNFTLTKK
jgi:hypothetical protein